MRRTTERVVVTAASHVLAACLIGAAAELPQEAYVWQRAWTEPLKHMIRSQGGAFQRLVPLGAEIAFAGDRPRVVRVDMDHALLRAAKCPVGVALRVGPYPGPFAKDSAPLRVIAATARTLVREAAAEGLNVSELQIDFDCATRHLAGYAVWVEAIRQEVAPTPVVITALPTWLQSSDFRILAAAADGFVLQVHSFERPDRLDDALTLCDPEAARRAVEQATGYRRPFRVALPTYAYAVVFDPQGKYVGIAAGGGPPAGGGTVRELSADPAAMAGLVRRWRDARPAHMQGVIWYRLPSGEAELNWAWSTLRKVMQGGVPRPELQAVAVPVEPGLWDVVLRNAGDGEAAWRGTLTVSWDNGSCVGADALAGFGVESAGSTNLVFCSSPAARAVRMRPETECRAGWVRLDGSNVEMRVEQSDITARSAAGTGGDGRGGRHE